MTPASRPDGPLSAFGLAIVIGTLAIDQGTKILAESFLDFARGVDVLPFLALYLTYNTGIAFSLLAGLSSGVLLVVTAAITLVVYLAWGTSAEGGRFAAAGYALIVGGALGNLIDRVVYGHVVDFLLLHWQGAMLFVFNIADAALTLGPLVLILAFLRPRAT